MVYPVLFNLILYYFRNGKFFIRIIIITILTWIAKPYIIVHEKNTDNMHLFITKKDRPAGGAASQGWKGSQKVRLRGTAILFSTNGYRNEYRFRQGFIPKVKYCRL